MKEDVKISEDGGILTVRICCEIDHHTAKPLRERIDRALFEKKPHSLVLDFSEVSFMDSSGLGLIMGRYTLMKKLGGITVLLDPSEAIMRIVSLAGLERIVKIERTKIGREAK